LTNLAVYSIISFMSQPEVNRPHQPTPDGAAPAAGTGATELPDASKLGRRPDADAGSRPSFIRRNPQLDERQPTPEPDNDPARLPAQVYHPDQEDRQVPAQRAPSSSSPKPDGLPVPWPNSPAENLPDEHREQPNPEWPKPSGAQLVPAGHETPTPSTSLSTIDEESRAHLERLYMRPFRSRTERFFSAALDIAKPSRTDPVRITGEGGERVLMPASLSRKAVRKHTIAAIREQIPPQEQQIARDTAREIQLRSALLQTEVINHIENVRIPELRTQQRHLEAGLTKDGKRQSKWFSSTPREVEFQGKLGTAVTGLTTLGLTVNTGEGPWQPVVDAIHQQTNPRDILLASGTIATILFLRRWRHGREMMAPEREANRRTRQIADHNTATQQLEAHLRRVG
jgi:hypothetical protein